MNEQELEKLADNVFDNVMVRFEEPNLAKTLAAELQQENRPHDELVLILCTALVQATQAFMDQRGRSEFGEN